MQWLSATTITSLIPIFAMLIPIVAIIGGTIQSRHEKAERYETIRTLARAGQPIPPELLRGLKKRDDSDENSAERRPFNALKTGIILVSVGLGVSFALYLMSPEGWLWGVGLIPLFLGFGFMVIWRLEPR
jgi:hypothetical protein